MRIRKVTKIVIMHMKEAFRIFPNISTGRMIRPIFRPVAEVNMQI